MKNISVIVPIYNGSKWIDRLLISLNNQTVLDNLEIICVDDGSTDDTLKILKKYENNHIKIISQINSGVSAARNKGIINASNDYISFVDADDYIENDYFENFINNISDNYDLYISGYVTEYANGKRINKMIKNKIICDEKDILVNYFKGIIDVNCWNKVFKKNILLKTLFDEKMKYSEDRDMLFRYLLQTKSICFIEGNGYHYIVNEESAMRKQYDRKSFIMLDKIEEQIEYLKKKYPDIANLANSYKIDAECRILSSLYEFNLINQNRNMFDIITKNIKNYSIIDKFKYSNLKHFFAFLAIRISPKLYIFLKNNMKLQYK